ncbi:ATP-binding protein [Sphingomonas sp. RT2P30]|uniref:sensor histidine kinase n=1 Tax=Parasphingomonas halimpatiens TaxID=3096162 RepID=UPI002FCCAD51
MALLIAVALFVAQGINFTLLLAERRNAQIDAATGPAVARIADALEREAAGRPIRVEGGRVQRATTSPVLPGGEHRVDVERALVGALAEAGVKAGRIETEVRPIRPDDPRLRHLPPRRVERMMRVGGELIIAVEEPGHGWLVTSTPWARSDALIVWRLIWQTLVLYVIVLVPVVIVTRRLAAPLRELASNARRFRPGGEGPPVEERGPPDVRAVIAAYNALRLRVTAMLDEKDRMLGAIGHDLRTPLAALRVRIESVEDEQDRAKMADTIAEMNRTLDDILSLARLGRPSEPLTEVDLAALVDAVVEDFRDLDADVSFTEAPRLRMWLRPSLMRRAIRNLIENAIKYGGGAEVALESAAGSVAIIVSDNGPGIPEEHMANVFEAFTRIETSRNKDTGGIGLGLALAGAIVREAGGDITLTNRAAGGLEARIVLPRG